MIIDIQALRQQQLQQASEVIRYDCFSIDQPVLIAGADVGFELNGTITRAAIAVLRYPSFELIDYQIARIATALPYIPGFLSFREYPALLVAWHKLQQWPDLVFVDGHGIAHPRRLGVASHFGVLINVPTIGVAKKRLCGNSLPLSMHVDALQPLEEQGEKIGWVWRSKVHCNPLFISTGHRISTDSALHWVKLCMAGYRLPETIRWADAIASNRPMFQRWQQKRLDMKI